MFATHEHLSALHNSLPIYYVDCTAVSPRLYIYRCALVTCPLHPCIEGMLLFCGLVAIATARKCTFCGLDSSGKAHEFDLSSLPSKTFELNDSRNSERYAVTTPCGNADTLQCGEQAAPVLQGCKGVGSLADRSEPGTGVRSWLDCVFVDLWFLFESILSVPVSSPRSPTKTNIQKRERGASDDTGFPAYAAWRL